MFHPKQTTSARAVAIRELVDFLRAIPIGETATYEALSRVIALPIQRHRHLLQKAFDTIIEEGIRFDNVYLVGYRRVPITDAIGVIDRDIRGVRRKARLGRTRAEKQLSRANDVSSQTEREINARISLLGMIEATSRMKSVREIEQVMPDKQVISIGRVIAAVQREG